MQSDDKPLISICCITYNHEPYIRDCLESFLMQRTDFPFEVLIHDDASTDHTADIIREYEARYPGIIKPIYQTENQYSQGINLFAFCFNRVHGKYIALCEGDDFWCDPQKLQKQFDFMEAHPDYSACFCGHYNLLEFDHCISPNGFLADDFSSDTRETQRNVLLGNHTLITAATFFRAAAWVDFHLAFAADTKGSPMSDLQLFFHLAGAGKIGYIRRRMAVYRQHGNSASSFENKQKQVVFLDACNKYIVKLAQRYGFADVAKLKQSPRGEFFARHRKSDSAVYLFFKRIKRTLRGDYRLYRMYRKLDVRERILRIGASCPE